MKHQQDVYAIRHKPSGRFMPSRMFRTSNRGWSHWEPAEDEAHDKNPRLFFTVQSARNALTMWLQGAWVNQTSAGTYFEPPEDLGPAPERPQAPRSRADMEIVTLRLQEA